jgi:ribosome-associated protein
MKFGAGAGKRPARPARTLAAAPPPRPGKPRRVAAGRGAGGKPSARARRALEITSGPTRLARVPRGRELVALEKVVLAALEDMKAVNVKVLDVRGLTDVADTMIVASGTSDRHVRAIAERVIERSKAVGRRPMGTEGRADSEWVLVDLQDVLVHVMLPRVREFYALEQLWEVPAGSRRAASAPAPAA